MVRRIASQLLAGALLAFVLGSAATLPCAALVAACEGCCCPHERAAATDVRSRGCCEMLPAMPGPPLGVAATAPDPTSRPDTTATPPAGDPRLDVRASASGRPAVETAPASLDPPPRWLRDCAFLI